MQFSAPVAEALRTVHRRLTTMQPDGKDEWSEVCLRAAMTIAPVDSFYVGYYEHPRTLRITYAYDDDEITGPDLSPYGERGLSAHIQQTERTYTWSQDDGRLIKQGLSYGNTGKRNLDAVVVPLRADDGALSGFMSFMSYRSSVFSGEHIAAFEWIASAHALAVSWFESQQAREDALLLALPRVELSVNDLSLAIEQELTAVLSGLSKILAERPADTERLTSIQGRCQETLALAHEANTALAAKTTVDELLSAREREVVFWVRRGMTNAQIGTELHLTERSVKGHMTRIMAKLGVARRSEI